MAHVVFFRAANVGGYQTFQPRKLAGELAHFGCVNVGAAGTFVVRSKVTESILRKAVLPKLSFVPEMMIRPADEIIALKEGPWCKKLADGVSGFVTVLAKPPIHTLELPLNAPATGPWQVSILAVSGACVLSVRRPGAGRPVYPNEVVEKSFGVLGTMRSWTTILKICDILRG